LSSPRLVQSTSWLVRELSSPRVDQSARCPVRELAYPRVVQLPMAERRRPCNRQGTDYTLTVWLHTQPSWETCSPTLYIYSWWLRCLLRSPGPSSPSPQRVGLQRRRQWTGIISLSHMPTAHPCRTHCPWWEVVQVSVDRLRVGDQIKDWTSYTVSVWRGSRSVCWRPLR